MARDRSCVAVLRGAYREVELDLWLDDRKVDLVDEDFDAVIRLGELTDSGLIARKVVRHHFTTCAAQSYLAAHGTPKAPAELVAHRCLRYAFPLQDGSSNGRSRERPRRKRSAEAGSQRRRGALAGLGVVQVPAYLVSEDLAAGRLQRLLVQRTADCGDIWLVWPEVRADIPRVRVFVDFVSKLPPVQAPTNWQYGTAGSARLCARQSAWMAD
jgi:DNA-binding transcriptional LysR family regulator